MNCIQTGKNIVTRLKKITLNINIMNDSNKSRYAEIWIVSPAKKLELYSKIYDT